MNHKLSRRTIIKTAASIVAVPTIVAAASPLQLKGAPFVRTRSRTDAASAETIIGEGDHQYRVDHQWCQLPDRFTWQTTHGVAVDKANNLYVIHEGRADQKEHPSIFVFGPDGKFMRAFGAMFQGGGHGIEIREEDDGHEYIYVAAYQQVKAICKLTLTGEIVWFQKAPLECGLYDDDQAVATVATWSRTSFLPTNFTFLDNGGFLLADGNGAWCIHRYDFQGNWEDNFGGPGDGNGKFNLPHGLSIDKRDPVEQVLLVCDCEHNTIQVLTPFGQHLKTIDGFKLPANVDIHGDLAVVAELNARVSLLDSDYNIVAKLGNDVDGSIGQEKLREQPENWKPGQFVHPHDACFDVEGNMFVAEWLKTGRITKLKKVS